MSSTNFAIVMELANCYAKSKTLAFRKQNLA